MPNKKPTIPNQEQQERFKGFDIPRQNWFKMPSDWTDLTAQMQSWAEQKVVEYVLKHTWGYQEYGGMKRISLDEFEHGRKRSDGDRIDNGIGMRRQAIISGIRQAIQDGFLVEQKDESDKARVKKYYGLRMLDFLNQGYENHTPGVRSSYPRDMKITHRTEKDTLERNDVVVIGALEKFKIDREKATELTQKYPQERIEEKIEYLTWKLETKSRGRPVGDPAAWLIRAIEKDYHLPEGFKTKAAREQEARERAEREAALERQSQEAWAAQEEERQQQLQALQDQYGTTQKELDLWPEVLAEVRLSTTQANYQAWYPRTVLLSLTEEEAVIGVPNKMTEEWLGHRQKRLLEEALACVIERPVALSFVVLDGNSVDP